MNPPCCLTIPYTIASPRPVPLSGPFVVKNGSNTRSRVFSSIPTPVSETVSRAYLPVLMYGFWRTYSSSRYTSSVSTTSRPPFGIASLAFRQRFMSTCSICPRSACMVGTFFSRDVFTSICSPTTLPINFIRSATRMLKFKLTGSMTWRRAKVSSCRVNVAARSAQRRISSRSCNACSSPAILMRRSSPNPTIPVRALLKSCAMPPARVPTASIFWAVLSCLSNSAFSVTSWAIDRTPLTFPDASRNNALNHSQVMIFPSFRTLAFRE